MSRTAPFLVALGLQFAACGGDDTVNPSNPEAGIAQATKDAAGGDAKATGSDAKASDSRSADAGAAE
jgi:hypothetical protein